LANLLLRIYERSLGKFLGGMIPKKPAAAQSRLAMAVAPAALLI
jgi:hypothetical protein